MWQPPLSRIRDPIPLTTNYHKPIIDEKIRDTDTICLKTNKEKLPVFGRSPLFVIYILITSNYCQNGVAYKSPLQRFIAPSKDFERFINAAFLIYSSVWITSSTFSFNFSNGLISSFVSCIQLLIL